jgi:hypothetical protein
VPTTTDEVVFADTASRNDKVRVAVPARLRGQVRTVVVAVAIGLIAGTVVAGRVAARPPIYGASALVQLDQPTLLETGGSQVMSKLNRLRDKYALLVGTDTILVPLASALGVPIDRLRGRVSAEAPFGDSLLISVDGRTSSASDAVLFANAAAEQMSRYADVEQSALAVPVAGRYRIMTVNAARAALKETPTGRQVLSSGAVFGLVVAALAYVGLELFQRRRRSHEGA